MICFLRVIVKRDWIPYLKNLPERQQMSLREAERERGVSNAYLAQIEGGDRPPPSPDILRKLAPACKKTLRDLFWAAEYLGRARD